MARTSTLEDLLSRLSGDEAAKEGIRALLRFGLVYEDSYPELLRLTGLRPVIGCRVDHASPEIHRFGTVVRPPADATVEAGIYAVRWDDDADTIDYVPAHDLVPVVTPGEPAYAGMKIIDTVERGGDAPHHLAIQGENLHALRTLRYTHAGKVDVIYIDPPYNTGGDLIYNDKYISRADSFRHSKWLSFMEPRLRLARELLKDTGIILVAIDDTEQAHLRLLMDEVFGERNFIANLIWKSKSGGANDSGVAVDHEYILVFGKTEHVSLRPDPHAQATTNYNYEDEHGRYALERLDKQNLGYQASLDFPIKGPDGQEYTVAQKNPAAPNARWRWSKESVAERYSELVFKDGHVYTKNYEKDALPPRSLLVDQRFGRTRTGTAELHKVFNDSRFKYPKNTRLLRHLLSITGDPNAIILDFFGGSGSTLHAVLEMNAADGGNRQCILVTNNELEAKERKRLASAGHYPGDPEYDARGIFHHVTYPRIKTVATGIREDGSTYSEGLDANVTFAELTYTNRTTVSLGRAFSTIAPLLWVKAGARGSIISTVPEEEFAIADNYAVLFDASAAALSRFRAALSASSLPAGSDVFVICDDDDQFTRAHEMLSGFQSHRLYRDYLTNFEVVA